MSKMGQGVNLNFTFSPQMAGFCFVKDLFRPYLAHVRLGGDKWLEAANRKLLGHLLGATGRSACADWGT